MAKFEVNFKRVESVRFMCEAESKAEVKDMIKSACWCLDDEKIDEIENKNFKITEIKEPYVKESEEQDE